MSSHNFVKRNEKTFWTELLDVVHETHQLTCFLAFYYVNLHLMIIIAACVAKRLVT